MYCVLLCAVSRDWSTAEADPADIAEADTADIAEADFVGSLCPCLSVVLVFFPYTEIENH